MLLLSALLLLQATMAISKFSFDELHTLKTVVSSFDSKDPASFAPLYIVSAHYSDKLCTNAGHERQSLLLIESCFVGGTDFSFVNVNFSQNSTAIFYTAKYYATNNCTGAVISTELHSESLSCQVTSAGSLKREVAMCRTVDATRYFVSNKENTAKCIDGTLPAYYHRQGFGDGTDKWIVFFEGGGWCWDLEDCERRSRTNIGSSKAYRPCLEYQLMNQYMSNNRNKNPMMYNWNTVYVRYCDGGSFAGDSEVQYKGTTLHFRGMQNRNAVIRSILRERGMTAASDVVIAGCSAGGLAIYMGLDHIADLIRQHNNSVQVRGFADSGFFPDYSSDYRMEPNQRGDPIIGGKLDYAGGMRRVYEFMGMNKGVHQGCVREQTALFTAAATATSVTSVTADKSVECAFAKNLAPHIRTPLFAVQSIYDKWQIPNLVGKGYSIETVNNFGAALLLSVQTALMYPRNNPGHGAFVDSCVRHCNGCSSREEDVWNGPRLVANITTIGATNNNFKGDEPINHNEAQAFRHWYEQSLSRVSVAPKEPMLFLQNRTFPCVDCCKCTMRV